ncbi:hypothetical protein PV325_007531 [Microctonus aethiopoides]|nr:hypothetical protein PV325_007531 [Microctonus aethiopoides]
MSSKMQGWRITILLFVQILWNIENTLEAAGRIHTKRTKAKEFVRTNSSKNVWAFDVKFASPSTLDEQMRKNSLVNVRLFSPELWARCRKLCNIHILNVNR